MTWIIHDAVVVVIVW